MIATHHYFSFFNCLEFPSIRFFLVFISIFLGQAIDLSAFSFPTDTTIHANYVIINDITVSGNKRTKLPIIFRELDFKSGDTLSLASLEAVLKESRDQVYNTGLFNEVKIEQKAKSGQHIDFDILVEERWYIYPVPVLELVDRNFNVWWNGTDGGKKRDFSRTVYGFRFDHENFRGRKEELIFTAQFGYTRKFELFYKIPSINRRQKTGLTPFISYILNREIDVTAQNHQLQLYEHNQYARKRFRTGLAVNHRQDIHQNHFFQLAYYNNTIADTISQMNPKYFLNGNTRQQYFFLSYVFTSDHRDIQAYPLAGNYFRLQASKMGMGIFNDINVFLAVLNYSRYFKWNDHFYTVANVRARSSFPARQDYFNRGGLGFGADFVRGYEHYVIDGQHFGMFRTAFKYKLLDTKFTNPILKADQFKTIPFAIFLKSYGELGYVRDKFAGEWQPLANKPLVSTGLGLDIFTLYDTVVSLEYTLNGKKEHGFYVAFSVNYDFE